MSELKTLTPEVSIETSQGTINLTPFKFKYFSKVLDLVAKYIDTFSTSNDAGEIAQKLMANAGEETLADICHLIYLASGKERDFLDELGWNEVTNILLTLIEENIDFFFQIGDRLNQLGRNRQETEAVDGQKQQQNSSHQDTSGAKSETIPSPSSTSS